MSAQLRVIKDILQGLAAAQKRSQERHNALAETVQMLTADVQVDAENIRALARNSQILHDSIKVLETVAVAHEQRIDGLENQI
jgi:paraquat-inducible protein B